MNPWSPYYGTGYDNGMIEHACPPEELEEGVDFVVDTVMDSDMQPHERVIRRPRP